ncbi:hypothetical protein G6N74_16660 [Mesorhizobium sp. CGMCC 1.15528]|uniref:Uncharacterized protein n=1 Tax=Mesorhizobium zhangyense TaxID=1776730 RepID=A0A7C9V8V7_9HYPH|nr:hypothetical protein [Mesorhizobium zhangyense]NGN42703.1 hypothetical protein [Mesorhizobium zhangyense]
MTTQATARRRRWTSAWLLVPAGLLLVAAANAHLVYVAVTSQPDCVPHLKEAGTDGSYRAAKSAC